MSATYRRPWRYMTERDVAEIERRLRLYRDNAPKRIAEDMRVHVNTVTVVNLGRHPIQARLASEAAQEGQAAISDRRATTLLPAIALYRCGAADSNLFAQPRRQRRRRRTWNR
jgi:hypothetical protein